LLFKVKRETKRVRAIKKSAVDGGGGWGVVDVFNDAVQQWPQQPFLVMADTGETLTFADMDARSNRVARWLASQGFTPGSTVIGLGGRLWVGGLGG
jgi:non-ribosomal peptide synthetase component E (peptide arylation enzyme)